MYGFGIYEWEDFRKLVSFIFLVNIVFLLDRVGECFIYCCFCWGYGIYDGYNYVCFFV